jgi:hypothetical protein
VLTLYSAKEERNNLHTINRRKDNWIGYILCRNCLLKHDIEEKIQGRIEVTGRRGKRHKPLLDELKQKQGYRKLKEEALDCILWRNGYGLAAGETTE